MSLKESRSPNCTYKFQDTQNLIKTEGVNLIKRVWKKDKEKCCCILEQKKSVQDIWWAYWEVDYSRAIDHVKSTMSLICIQRNQDIEGFKKVELGNVETQIKMNTNRNRHRSEAERLLFSVDSKGI